MRQDVPHPDAFADGGKLFTDREAIVEEKARIRAEARERRRKLPPDCRRDAEARIRTMVWERLADAQEILCYISTAEEVGTRQFLSEWLTAGRQVFAPAVIAPGQPEWRPLLNLDSLIPGTFGVPEPPPPGESTPIGTDWPVVVPCVAFGPRGQRLGYGGGYFDRFLATHRGTAIGLAFDCQRYDNIPQEPHDIQLTYIITEQGMYSTGEDKPSA